MAPQALSETKERRFAANRANAARSTGPKSARGKRVASQNSRKHGLTRLNVHDRGASELGTALAAELSPRAVHLASTLANCFETLCEISTVRSGYVRRADIWNSPLEELASAASKICNLERYEGPARSRLDRIVTEILLLGRIIDKTDPSDAV
jgi:hypothetical protein